MLKYKIIATLFSSVFLILLFVSCKKDKEMPSEQTIPGTKTIHGRAQKGPYKNGSPLVIYELNNSLGQTGKSFASTINDDAGNFSLNNINLSSKYILLTATGYYFNEHFNKISEDQLYLEALADVSNISTVNVNLLTHIIKPRIEQLASTGLDFNSSRNQAQIELLAVLGTSVNVSGNFETMDLTSDGFLFAISLLFQRNNSFGYQLGYNYTAELSSLLSNFKSDFANNGVIDNHNIIDTLVYNARRVDLIDCKNDMQNYFSGLGVTFSGSGFEQYIYNFQKKYSTTISPNIVYPDTAAIKIDAPGASLPYTCWQNLLKVNKKNFAVSGFGGQCSVSAIVPYDSTLIIKFRKITVGLFPLNIDPSSLFGWKMEDDSVLTFIAQRKNIHLSFLFSGAHDSVKVEYYKTLSTPPFYTKTIVFN